MAFSREDASAWNASIGVGTINACASAHSFEKQEHTSPEPQPCAPTIVQALEYTAHATWFFPLGPGPASGGKGPTKHPGFIVPQKEGTNYSPHSGAPRRKQRPVGWRRWKWGWGRLKKGERKPQDTFQSFSSTGGGGKKAWS